MLACADHLGAVVLALLVLGVPVVALLVLRRRGGAVSKENRLEVEAAFAEMDALDAREAPEGEYEAPLRVLGTRRLPSWAAAMAIDRLTDRESPSRRRYLSMLEHAEIREERERLVEIARDVTDPLAADVWVLLTGRPPGEWAKALVASDGGENEKEFLRRAAGM